MSEETTPHYGLLGKVQAELRAPKSNRNEFGSRIAQGEKRLTTYLTGGTV